MNDIFISASFSFRNYVKNNICFMNHHQEELVLTQFQKREPQDQLLESKNLCGGGQPRQLSPEI